MSHNSTALAQLSAANARKTEENRSHINKIVAPHFTADLCVKIATRPRYVSGKPLLTHPFKLKQTADLCVRSGEVMVFLALAYLLVIGTFMVLYLLLDPHLAWYEAIVVSMTAFHGRGFSPSAFSPGDPLSIASAIEAFVGLIIEVTFIATLTRRFFGQ